MTKQETTPLTIEIAPLSGQEREDAITEAQELLADENFNSVYFSRVITNVGRLLGGTQPAGFGNNTIESHDLRDTGADKLLKISTYAISDVANLKIFPTWMALPEEERTTAKGQTPYTIERTQMVYSYGRGLPPVNDAPRLQLTSTMWFPTSIVDQENYLGYPHWTENDGDVYHGWAKREKVYFPNPESQRLLAQKVFDAWQTTQVITSEQR